LQSRLHHPAVDIDLRYRSLYAIDIGIPLPESLFEPTLD